MNFQGKSAAQRGMILVLFVILVAATTISRGTVINLYTTGFEPAEGYDSDFDLEGQQGWMGTGGNSTNDNGLVSGSLPGMGQSAYIGYGKLAPGEDFLYLWQPLSHTISSNQPIVKFSVHMKIVDSTFAKYDSFRWSVFNNQVERLFSLDFDNADLGIRYLVQNSTNFVYTGHNFSNNVPYHLVITMDFARTNWSATLDDTLLLTNVPLSTVSNTALDLGDIDAVWVYGDPAAPGDNYMVFDNYTVTEESATSSPPQLTNFQRLSNGQFLLRLNGEPGRRYVIEATTNLTSWSSIRTNTATDGFFDFLDTDAPGFPRRFYRGRLLPLP